MRESHTLWGSLMRAKKLDNTDILHTVKPNHGGPWSPLREFLPYAHPCEASESIWSRNRRYKGELKVLQTLKTGGKNNIPFLGGKYEEILIWFHTEALDDPLKTSHWLNWAELAHHRLPSQFFPSWLKVCTHAHLGLRLLLTHAAAAVTFLHFAVSDLKEKTVNLEQRCVLTGMLHDPCLVLKNSNLPATSAGVLFHSGGAALGSNHSPDYSAFQSPLISLIALLPQ